MNDYDYLINCSNCRPNSCCFCMKGITGVTGPTGIIEPTTAVSISSYARKTFVVPTYGNVTFDSIGAIYDMSLSANN